jgi:hypothetical protein
MRTAHSFQHTANQLSRMSTTRSCAVRGIIMSPLPVTVSSPSLLLPTHCTADFSALLPLALFPRASGLPPLGGSGARLLLGEAALSLSAWAGRTGAANGAPRSAV